MIRTPPPPPSYAKTSSPTEHFENTAQNGSSTKCYGTVRQNNFDRKSWNPPPLLYLNCFDNKIFLKQWRVPLEVVFVLWDKNFLTENLDTPPPLLSINFCPAEKFWDTAQKGSSTKCYGTVRQRNSTRKIDSPPPPHLFHKISRQRSFSGTHHRWVPLRNVKVLWDKPSSTENRDNRPLSYPLQYSIPEIFWYLDGFLDKTFQQCETKKNSSEKIDTPSSFFLIQ